jgi:hypothetical protein
MHTINTLVVLSRIVRRESARGHTTVLILGLAMEAKEILCSSETSSSKFVIKSRRSLTFSVSNCENTVVAI